MRTGLYIPQRAIVEKDLLGNVTTDAWLLLDYLRRWMTCKNLKRVQVRGRDFFWIKYSQACHELPILFPQRPILRTQINKMVRLIASLKRSGLIETHRFASRCFVHVTQRAQELYVKQIDPDSRLDEHGVTPVNDGRDTQKRDGLVTGDHDTKEQYKNEQHEKERQYKNNYSDDELECVKRRLETIFPKRVWSSTEIALLRAQMPIPEWELRLIVRFYQLPNPSITLLLVNVPANKLDTHEFLLVRRRHSMKTLLEYWGDEVGRAQWFFQTDHGIEHAEAHGWDLGEMHPPPTTPM